MHQVDSSLTDTSVSTGNNGSKLSQTRLLNGKSLSPRAQSRPLGNILQSDSDNPLHNQKNHLTAASRAERKTSLSPGIFRPPPGAANDGGQEV